MNKTDKDYCQRYRNSIQDEYDHLHNRMVVLTLLDVLFQTNPDFFDEDTDEIVQPWRTIFDCYADVLDEDHFINRLQKIQQQKSEPVKRKPSKKKAK